MSIHDEISEHLQAGKLAAFRPPGRKPAKRALFLSEDAQKDLNNPQSAVCLLVGRGFLEAAMARWVTGGRVYGAPRFLCRLDPPPKEIWEIRVTEPREQQARLFCRFAAPDTLIVTAMRTRALLRAYGSPNWASAMARCESAWQQLFPQHQPFSGRRMSDYVLENCDDFEL